MAGADAEERGEAEGGGLAVGPAERDPPAEGEGTNEAVPSCGGEGVSAAVSEAAPDFEGVSDTEAAVSDGEPEKLPAGDRDGASEMVALPVGEPLPAPEREGEPELDPRKEAVKRPDGESLRGAEGVARGDGDPALVCEAQWVALADRAADGEPASPLVPLARGVGVVVGEDASDALAAVEGVLESVGQLEAVAALPVGAAEALPPPHEGVAASDAVSLGEAAAEREGASVGGAVEEGVNGDEAEVDGELLPQAVGEALSRALPVGECEELATPLADADGVPPAVRDGGGDDDGSAALGVAPAEPLMFEEPLPGGRGDNEAGGEGVLQKEGEEEGVASAEALPSLSLPLGNGDVESVAPPQGLPVGEGVAAADCVAPPPPGDTVGFGDRVDEGELASRGEGVAPAEPETKNEGEGDPDREIALDGVALVEALAGLPDSVGAASVAVRTGEAEGVRETMMDAEARSDGEEPREAEALPLEEENGEAEARTEGEPIALADPRGDALSWAEPEAPPENEASAEANALLVSTAEELLATEGEGGIV